MIPPTVGANIVRPQKRPQRQTVVFTVTKQTGFGESIWQKSFYDEILRNDKACDAVYRYIDENPIYYENDDV